MRRLEKFAAVLLLLGLAGCKLGWLIDRTAPDTILNCKSYFEELHQGRIDQVLESFDPSGDKDRLRGDLEKVAALIPQQEYAGVETLGATAECKLSGVCTKQVVLEYKYPDRWILFRVTVSNQSGHDAITDLFVQPESVPVESMSHFTLHGKGWLYYFILLMALLSAGLALYALVVCIRTPIRKQKWLWAIVTILGLGEFGIQWSSGELWYKILHISILPMGWGFDIDSPFMYFSIPAGAILFLLLRSGLRRADTLASPISADAGVATDRAENDSSQWVG